MGLIEDTCWRTGLFHLTRKATAPAWLVSHLLALPFSFLLQIIVMESKEDGVLSFAMDEFPVVTDDAIEQFWIQKVID